MMRNTFALLVFCLIFLFQCKGQTPGNSSPKPDYSPYYFHRIDHFERLPDTPDEIFFLGNSISDGCEWSELFGDLRIKNRGISGDRTDGVLYRLHQITRCKPKQVFLMIGINDLAGGGSVDQIIANHKKIYNRIEKESPKTQIIVQSVLPVNNEYGLFTTHTNKGDSILKINEQLKVICKERAYTFVDLFARMVNKKGKLRKELTVDGLHLNGLGYQVWKEKIEDLIK